MFNWLSRYNPIVIGETHTNPRHANKEARIIRKKKSEYILFESFVDCSTEDIMRFLEHEIKVKDSDIEYRHPMFKAILESGAIPLGCDSRFLLAMQNKYFNFDPEIYSNGIEHFIQEVNRFEQILNERNEYMANKISEYANMGKTIAIIGRGHLQKVDENLRKIGLKAKCVYLE